NICKIFASSSPEVPVSSCGDGWESLKKRIMRWEGDVRRDAREVAVFSSSDLREIADGLLPPRWKKQDKSNNRSRGIGSPAGKWLQAAYSHQDFTWMQLEEERKAKPRSPVATSSAAFLEIHEDIAPKLQCWDVAMRLLTHLYLKEQQRPVVNDKKQMVANIEKQLEEARELLEQMELEVREIPPQSRGMYSSRMRSYKQEMGKLEADFKRSRIAYSDEVRNELLGDDGNSSENQLIKLREERAHLLDNTERLERSSRRLEAGYQIAVET
ncbi:PREDICTED: vesicle transport through interaction with t-SNAREs homolog 1A, partial [Fulmarus glacialis]|uniref:vesicle transport through interaction with t-SNAREs homolog 1A n=1 Tax=Fulmarus glacialis TaxID=30455 RepID=UPI00051CA5C3